MAESRASPNSSVTTVGSMTPRAPRLVVSRYAEPASSTASARFTRMSTADGLSQTRVSQIVQDDRGFIWFGTQYGIDRYDGYEFKVFVHEAGRVNSLAG